MNPDTLNALEKSIYKWDMIAMGLWADEHSSNCALCIRFSNEGELSNECITSDEEKCPVYLSTCYTGCEETPWEYWQDLPFYEVDYSKNPTEKEFIRPRTLPNVIKYCVSFLNIHDSNLAESINETAIQRIKACDLVEAEVEFLISLLPENHKWRNE